MSKNKEADVCKKNEFTAAKDWLEVQNVFYARREGWIQREEFWSRLEAIWNRIGKK